MSLQAPALPAGIDSGVIDAEASVSRRRDWIEPTLTVIATVAAVLAISLVGVAIELVR